MNEWFRGTEAGGSNTEPLPCRLRQLPDPDYWCFPVIEELNFSDNQLEGCLQLPHVKGLRCLRVGGNQLTQLPHHWERFKDTLRILDVSNNPLELLPSGGDCRSVKKSLELKPRAYSLT